MNYKYAIFDMDGTILDSMFYWRNLVPEYGKKNGLNPLSADEINKLQGMDSDLYHDYMVKKDAGYLNFDEATMVKMMEYHYENTIMPRKGIVQLLETLKSNGVKMCICSQTPTELIWKALKKHNLDKYFEFALSPTEYPHGKSTTEIFFAVAERFKAEFSEIALFEDALYSMKTAKPLGIYIVAVSEQFEKHNHQKIAEISDEFYQEFSQFLG